MQETLKNYKNAMRKKYLDIWDSFTKEDIRNRSAIIFNKLKETPEYKNANNIMCFVSFNNEVETHEFIEEAILEGKSIYIPVILDDEPESIFKKTMKISKIESLQGLIKNHMGILQPPCETLKISDAKELDLLVVPGIVFDKRGYRIGYGGAFYDRFITFLDSQKPGIPKIGVCFNESYIEEVPYDIYDKKVDSVITD